MRRIEWQKIKLDDGAYESAAVLDVNNDGQPDIVCGAYWHEGPDWKKHKLCDLPVVGHGANTYYNDFATIPIDVNGDGFTDVVTGGWFDESLVWRENPQGRPVEWKTHLIDRCGHVETARGWDLDGDGELEIVPNLPQNPLCFYKIIRTASGAPQFRKIQISQEKQGHGLGFGLITGDGKRGLIVYNGWWEMPPDPLNDPWTFHPEFDFGRASIPILAEDINGDGLPELIVGQAHGYGLDYYQQSLGASGARTWTRHPIDPYFSQYHAMEWVDIDGDGQCELITGNRHHAHCGRDPGETDTVGLYCFKWNGENFTKQVIDHGRKPNASGAGIYFAVADLNADGRLDIVAPGKEGLYIFLNLGCEAWGLHR